MNELIDFLNQNGVNLNHEPVIDSDIHRFDFKKKNDGWYVCFDVGFLICIFGSWISNEKFVYKPDKKFTRQENKIIDERIKEAQEKLKEAKLQENLDVAKKCENNFKLARQVSKNTYLDKKNVKAHGIKRNGNTLLIPMRDIKGKLWGLQKISEDGSKYFETGQKTSECFHQIGSDTDTFYICEGYATGASIFEAINQTVIITFSGNNMEKVAAILRKAHPESSIVICGDNDEPGIKYAEATKKVCFGEIIYPTCNDGTDFNDMAKECDIKPTLLKVKPERVFLKCLGYRDTANFYTSSSMKRILRIPIGSHNSAFLRQLMSDDYWAAMYPSKNKEGINWGMAENDLKSNCRLSGFFMGDKIRGSGIWKEKEGIIANLGDKLYINGEFVEFSDFKPSSNNTYILDKKINFKPDELTKEDALKLYNLAHMLNFKHKVSPTYLLGWIVISMACGALKWRSHLWITGQAGSGKTWVVNNIVLKCISKMVLNIKSASSTEAGIRQDLGSSALPVMIDELESDRKGQMEKVKSIVELMRQSSSDDGASILKGSAGGESVKFVIKFCVLASSINSTIDCEADKSRISVLELMQGKDNFKEIEKAVDGLPENICDKILTKVLNNFQWLDELISLYHEVFKNGETTRFKDQHAPLFAGAKFLMTEPNEIDCFDAAIDIGGYDLKEDVENTKESRDHETCLDVLLASIVKYYDVDKDRTIESSIGNLLKKPDVLKNYGIKVFSSSFVICNSHPELKRLFKETRWEGGQWRDSLKRLPGAITGKSVYFNGRSHKGVEIPFKNNILINYHGSSR